MIRVTQPVTGMPGTLPHFEVVQFRRDGEKQHLGFEWQHDYRNIVMLLRTPETQPHAEDFQRAIQRQLNSDWDLDILIAQAKHYSQNNWDSNPALALFLAALVAETKMKRVLWRDTPPELQPDLLEEVPRNKALKYNVEKLFSSVASKYINHSLKKERPRLWAEMLEVFPHRNNFAHQAEPVTQQDANRAVDCIRNVLLWADNGARQNYRH